MHTQCLQVLLQERFLLLKTDTAVFTAEVVSFTPAVEVFSAAVSAFTTAVNWVASPATHNKKKKGFYYCSELGCLACHAPACDGEDISALLLTLLLQYLRCLACC